MIIVGVMGHKVGMEKEEKTKGKSLNIIMIEWKLLQYKPNLC